MINLNNLNWQDILVLCLKKFEYEKAAALYSSLSPVQRIIAAITGRKPKDPCPDLSSDALAVRYQSAFNKAHRFNGVPFGVRTNINDNDTVHITLNKNSIPNDPEKPGVTSGVRIGTPAATTRGFTAEEMPIIAECIDLIVQDYDKNRTYVAETVKSLTKKHPIYA